MQQTNVKMRTSDKKCYCYVLINSEHMSIVKFIEIQKCNAKWEVLWGNVSLTVTNWCFRKIFQRPNNNYYIRYSVKVKQKIEKSVIMHESLLYRNLMALSRIRFYVVFLKRLFRFSRKEWRRTVSLQAKVLNMLTRMEDGYRL